MARTKTPAPAPAVTIPEPPPDPPTQDVARPSPVLAWPAEWPVPELPAEKQRRTRGLPMGPVLAGAGNGTTLVATAAYSAGGPAAAVATGVVVAAGVTAAALRRRAAVRRGMAGRTGGGTGLKPSRSGSGSGLRSGPSGGGGRSGSGSGRGFGGGRSGAGSAPRSGLGRGGSGLLSGGSRSGSGTGSRSGSTRSGGGLLRGKGGRHSGPRHGGALGGGLGSAPGKDASRRQKRATEKAAAKAGRKAAEKALKQAAKNTAAPATPSRSQTLKAATSRAARAAVNAASPHTVRAAKAAGRHARRAGGALLDGARAVAAGAWTWLRRRDTAAALDRLKKVWRRLRKQRATPDTPTTPAVADTVRRPTHATPTTPSGGTRMSGGHHFVAAATEMARAAAAYQPTGMLQVGQDFVGLEEALRINAEALKTTVENADANWPLHPNIVELMRQIHGLQLKAAELATELKPAFHALHDVDIARLENPRTGERMWDFSSNL
ncbi:hypothetical protein PV355_01605 [Streptomyces stelliscabiei]|uniref:hypothetical protein n=1 Tax=Streptomyces stelliscabiei TaxID=146820 RepID=UPI0029A0A7F0|nr:hypothetical protein [Streptomyces stelliscabiei]MDX2513862.1 hypothetical protein [Streptomyces stelliscabiei]